MSPRSRQREFMFVNKNVSSSSLTSSEAAEKAELLSHVQARRRRLAATMSTSPPRWQAFTSVLPIRSSSEGEHDRPSQTPSPVPQSEADLPFLEHATLVVTRPKGDATDPFHCTVVGGTLNPHRLLQFGMFGVSSTTLLAETFAPPHIVRSRPWIRHEKMLLARLHHCVDNSMLMFSTLAFSSSSLAWSTGQLMQDYTPEFFIGKTLTAVSDQLVDESDQSNDWLQISIITLALTELWNAVPDKWRKCPTRAGIVRQSSTNSSRIHLTALLNLVDRSGGIPTVEPYVMECAIIADKYLAIAARSRPILPAGWDPGPVPPNFESDGVANLREFANLGRKFAHVRISESLQSVVQDIAVYLRSAFSLWSKLPDEAEQRWLFLRLQALTMDVLSMLDLDKFEECVRLSVLLFLLQSLSFQGARIFCAVILRQLRDAFGQLPSGRLHHMSKDEEELVFWCYCTAGLSSESSEDRSWFINRLTHLSGNVDLEMDLEPAQGFMLNYLFNVETQQQRLSDLISTIKERIAYETV